MKSTTGLYAATLVAAGLVFAPIANAQTSAQTSPPAAPSTSTPAPSSADIPDKKLDAAAAAAKKVVAVGDAYEKKIAQAPEADKQRLTGEAKQATIKAVSDEGLSVDEYAMIMRTAQNDPAVRDRLIRRLK